MQNNPIERWHQIVADRDHAGLANLLADDVVFHSPVMHTPLAGKAVTLQYLQAAIAVFYNPAFRYVREIVGSADAALEFEVTLGGIFVNGVDLIHWNPVGRIVDFKVMIRPLKAVQLIHQQMASMLAPKG